MGQQEVLAALVQWRKTSDRWFSAKEVHQRLLRKEPDLKIHNIRNSLFKLAAFNLVEWRGVGFIRHFKQFRGYKRKIK